KRLRQTTRHKSVSTCTRQGLLCKPIAGTGGGRNSSPPVRVCGVPFAVVVSCLAGGGPRLCARATTRLPCREPPEWSLRRRLHVPVLLAVPGPALRLTHGRGTRRA